MIRNLPGELFIEVEGADLSQLEKEAGGHRIQRIPPTERKGRVHTSTVTVAITDPTIRKVDYRESDFRIEWYSGTGCGGQFRNKHQNSCRMTHVPTGQTATAQCRSRQNSLEQAKKSLINTLQSAHYTQAKADLNFTRKNQVGSGMRGDKIRTIRFQDNTVLDHRTNKRMTADMYMKGYMDRLWTLPDNINIV